MSGQSPASVLYSSDGYELAVVGGALFEPGTRAIIGAGFDGANTRMILTDINGRQIVNQGLPNTLTNAWPVKLTDGYGNLFGEPNNPIYITGSIAATNPSVGTDGAAALGFDTQVGGKVSTTLPSYTNGNLDALSLTTTGLLRVDGYTGIFDSHAVTLTGSAFPAYAEFMGGAVTTAAPTYTNNTVNALSLDIAGNLRVIANQGTSPWVISGTVTTNKAGTSSVTSVASSATNTTLLAANANRIFASVYNNSSKQVFIKLGTTASAASFSILLMPNSYWEVPNDWTGQIDAIWSAANGSALITELTA